MNRFDLSDEILMAYADATLPESEASVVRAAAAHDPAIAARIEMFRYSQRLLREAFEPALLQPVPQQLRDTVQGLGRDEASSGLATPAARRPRRRRLLLPTLLAAAAALLLTLATNRWQIPSGADHSTGNLLAVLQNLPEPLSEALDRTPSGELASLRLASREVELLPLASYEDAGTACREFELSSAATAPRESLRGLVCRDSGHWLLRAASVTEAGKPSADDYLPASGSSELAARLGLRQPLSAQEERQRIERNWR